MKRYAAEVASELQRYYPASGSNVRIIDGVDSEKVVCVDNG
jgi:hypothetical protein